LVSSKHYAEGGYGKRVGFSLVFAEDSGDELIGMASGRFGSVTGASSTGLIAMGEDLAQGDDREDGAEADRAANDIGGVPHGAAEVIE
jgi:hypothetical protein